MRRITIFCFLAALVFLSAKHYGTRFESIEGKTVSEVLEALGEDFEDKKPNFDIPNVSAESGKNLFLNGFSLKENGKKSKKQSKHFVCTSCHNIEKEDPNLAIAEPQARLEYTNKKGLPFLQGTTMFGAVNRETYYNGDYDKKYGDLVASARNDIRGAIQLCAVECAQGRPLKDWEMESVLAYLWTLELKVEDLEMTSEEVSRVEEASNPTETVELLKSKYLQASPATFIPPPPDRRKGSGLVGNADNGRLIYDNSCLHCHFQGKYSFFHLDDTKMSFKHLKKTAGTFGPHSIYQVIRWGVPSKSGKPSYMPQYPEEKMSQQQLADLRAYIDQRAE